MNLFNADDFEGILFMDEILKWPAILEILCNKKIEQNGYPLFDYGDGWQGFDGNRKPKRKALLINVEDIP